MPVLVIGGMHRSGTSLTAHWLHQCGLFIGDDLLVSKYVHANPEGEHYEDLEILKLHKAILRSNRLNDEGYVTDEIIKIPSNFQSQAEQIIAKRQARKQWGWKEPRTSLLMEWWQEFLSNAYQLIVYRSPERVADSLLRRKLDHPLLVRRWFYRALLQDHDAHVAHYIQVWTRYNQDLLDAAGRWSGRTLILRIDDLIPQSIPVIQYMNTSWGFELERHPMGEIFENNRLKQQTSYVNLESSAVAAAMQAAEPVLAALGEWRQRTLSQLSIQDRHDL